MTRQEVPVASHSAALLPESWRRWQHAVDTMLSAAEAEDFQAVGMQLRECLIGFAQEVASDELVPAGEQRPQAANASRDRTPRGVPRQWVELGEAAVVPQEVG
jgi:hypothetical protein